MSTSPVVGYAYKTATSGAMQSRLTEMHYPNGRELDYIYDSGIDNSISRLSSIADFISDLGMGDGPTQGGGETDSSAPPARPDQSSSFIARMVSRRSCVICSLAL